MRTGQTRVGDLDVLKQAALEQRREPPAYRFNLGELWHPTTLPSAHPSHRRERRVPGTGG